MTSTPRPQPLFILRTDEIAGRQQELRKLQQTLDALQRTAQQTLLFYIAGDGGMGKTRLLQWVAEQPLHAKTFRTNILDMYDSILRTDVDLVEQIYDDIEKQLGKLPKKLQGTFTVYRNLRERYRRQEVGATGGQFRGEVLEAFYTGWLPLAKVGYRLIVLIDTAELLRFEDDPVRKAFEPFGALQPTASAKNWLEKVVGDEKTALDDVLPGVLFIVAGRKEESKELYTTLCRLANVHAQPNSRIIELSGLTREGVDQYIEALAQKLESENFTFQAQQLREDIEADLRQALFYLTAGSPIALSILLQIYINQQSQEIESLVNEQLASPSQAVANAEKRLQKALVKTLAEQKFGETSTAIRYMSLARKGLTPTRLQALHPLDNLEANKPIFEDLRQLIFVKKRPDGSLVLHDKVADWTEEGFYADDESPTTILYKKLLEQYEQEIGEIEKTVESLSTKSDPVESDEEEKNVEHSIPPESDPFAHENSQTFRKVRRARRNLLVERMTYALRSDPIRGYKYYFELAEEAFNVGRMDYESQIRSEFLGWWDHQEPANSDNYKYRNRANANGLSEELIRADFAIRIIQREYNRESPEGSPTERMQDMVKLVTAMLKQAQEGPFQIPEFAQILLAVYADTAKGQMAGSEAKIKQVRTSFQKHIKQLSHLLQQSRTIPAGSEEDELPIETFLILNALAFAHYELGFFESNHGNHGNAIDSYTRSLLPYRELHFDINQARSLNDKAYSLATIGDSDAAETAVADALRIRKRLGFSYLAALSYNTLGIVRTMGERPLTAINYCDYALRTFRGLSHEFGQMIAHRALSEAYRRGAEYKPNDRAGQIHHLVHALNASLAATSLANELLSEQDFLLPEILDECGCAYRDIAHFYFKNPDLDKSEYINAYSESECLLKKASEIARNQPSARTSLVDSMINLAYLSFYRLSQQSLENGAKEVILNEVKQLILAALAEVPDAYRDPTNRKHKSTDLTVYWAHLAKAHSLLVRIARTHLNLVGRGTEHKTEREQFENDLLQASIYTLYFRSLLRGNVRSVRRAHLAVYESFQDFTGVTLNRLYKQAGHMSKTIGIRPEVIEGFLEKDFGLG